MAARRREASRKGFPPNLYMKPDGYFWYRNPKDKRTKGLGRDKTLAFREARNANAALESDAGLKLADWVLGKDGKTLRKWAMEYQETYIEKRGAAKTTIASLKSAVRAILAASFAGKRINEITAREIAMFIEESASTRGARMAIVIRSTMLDMFREAEVSGLVEKNRVAVTRNPTATVMRDRLSLDQFLAIRAQATGWEVNAMNLALLTAQRREDVSQAEFKAISDGFWYCQQRKTGTKLRIPLSLRLSVLDLSLEEAVRQCRDDVVSQYLIHHSAPGRRIKAGSQVFVDTISKAFARARDAAKIEWQEGRTPPTFHEIRSLSERLYAEEYGSEFTQRLLGHKSPKMTAVYHDTRGSEWLEVIAR